jgi:hypothetical protein
VGSIDLIGNIRAIREARDLLDGMLGDAEAELLGQRSGIKPVALTAASVRAVAANKTRRETLKHQGSGSDKLIEGSAASWAADAIRRAGRPLTGPELVKAIDEQGHKVKLTTLVGSLYRWVKKKSVFYLAGANTFGLIELRGK